MKDTVESIFAKLPNTSVVCFVVKSDKYEDFNRMLLSKLIGSGMLGCYVTVNKPYNYLLNSFNAKNINTSTLFFVDCITKGVGGSAPKLENCIFVDSPQDLVSLSIGIHDTIKKRMGEKQFIVIDSLSTLSLHNEPERVLKFVHYLTGKMRLWDIGGVFISLHEETDQKLIAELSQFCDSVIRV